MTAEQLTLRLQSWSQTPLPGRRSKGWPHYFYITWMALVRGLDPSSGIVNLSWSRFDDTIINDPRMRKLGENPLARALFYEAYIWSDRENTDGFIDDVVVEELCRGFRVEKQACVDRLVGVGLWKRGKDGYYIVDWAESGLHKPRTQVLAEREAIRLQKQQAGRKGAAARWHRPMSPSDMPPRSPRAVLDPAYGKPDDTDDGTVLAPYDDRTGQTL
jgi:hypothetical protein